MTQATRKPTDLIRPVPLTKAAFAPFGDVIDHEGVTPKIINQGFAQRFNNLSPSGDLGEALAVDHSTLNISLFIAMPRPLPIEIKVMERHPLASQAFYPLQQQPWLVLVAEDPRDPASYRAFIANGTQGITYRRNAWHHPLLVRDAASRFLVVDRKGLPEQVMEAVNLEEYWLNDPLWLEMPY